MDNTWVKLYRKAKYNDIMRDPNAWLIFSWILLSVNKNTGKWKIGRFLLSKMTGIKPSTLYKAIKRLSQNYNVISLKSNNKFTEISVLKWDKFQPSFSTVTSKEHQSNNKGTLNKNIRHKTLVSKDTNEKTYGDEEVNNVIQEFQKNFGYKPTDKYPRRWAYLFSKHKGVKKATACFEWMAQDKAYSRITTLESAYRKYAVYEKRSQEYEPVTKINRCPTCSGREWVVGELKPGTNTYTKNPCPTCVKKKDIDYENIQGYLVA